MDRKSVWIDGQKITIRRDDRIEESADSTSG